MMKYLQCGTSHKFAAVGPKVHDNSGLPNLVMTNSSPWKPWPIEIDGLPIKNGGSFHSYVTVYQRVNQLFRRDVSCNIHVPKKWSIMWVKQCHKPPITGNGKRTIYKNGDDWGWFMALFSHIIPHLSIYRWIFHF